MKEHQRREFLKMVGAVMLLGLANANAGENPARPFKGRPQAPKEVQEKLNWPPKGADAYGKVDQSIVMDSFNLVKE